MKYTTGTTVGCVYVEGGQTNNFECVTYLKNGEKSQGIELSVKKCTDWNGGL